MRKILEEGKTLGYALDWNLGAGSPMASFLFPSQNKMHAALSNMLLAMIYLSPQAPKPQGQIMN